MDKPEFPKRHLGFSMTLIENIARDIVDDLKKETDPKELGAFFTFDEHSDSDIRKYVGEETKEYVDYVLDSIKNSVELNVYNMLTDPNYNKYLDDLPNGWNWYTGKSADDEYTDYDYARDDELRFSD